MIIKTVPKDEHHSQTEEGSILQHDRRHDCNHVHYNFYKQLLVDVHLKTLLK
jgi:hypothetical protein